MRTQNIALLFTATLLICLVQACSTITSEPKIGDAIEGQYKVGYSLSPQDDPSDIGSLSLADGHYVFTQQAGIDIPEQVVERLFFIENATGDYELIYDYTYLASENVKDVADGEFIVRIIFTKENPITNNGFNRNQVFLIRYDATDNYLYFHSSVSEIEFWQVAKSLK